jgi:CheY-like chemotaxis protein
VPDRSHTASEEISAVIPTDHPGSHARASAARADDLADALHEVSNALTVILGWIERARTESHSPSSVERALDVAAARASQARDLVRRAIGAEVALGAPRLASTVVTETVLGLEPEARRAGVKVEICVDRGAEALCVAQPANVVQILTNLLLNAISLSSRGSTVTVDVRPRRGRRSVVFGVADEGPGIPPERRRTLFIDGISTRPGGAGIGLRVAAGLARASGGELSLADSARGARFELQWLEASAEGGGEALAAPPPADGAPADEHHKAPADPPPPVKEKGGATLLSAGTVPLRDACAPASSQKASLYGARILLVEDDEAVIDLLDTALTARGADVVSIRSGHEIGPALAAGPFDVALFDISPIRDDIEGALSSVRKANGALRVVLISGSAVQMPSLPAEWVAAWVRKPFEVSEIMHALGPHKSLVPPDGKR